MAKNFRKWSNICQITSPLLAKVTKTTTVFCEIGSKMRFGEKNWKKQELDRREQRLQTGYLCSNSGHSPSKTQKIKQTDRLETNLINEIAEWCGHDDPYVIELQKKDKLGTLVADDFTKWYRLDDPAILELRKKEEVALNG